jgi:hypothetical protein
MADLPFSVHGPASDFFYFPFVTRRAHILSGSTWVDRLALSLGLFLMFPVRGYTRRPFSTSGGHSMERGALELHRAGNRLRELPGLGARTTRDIRGDPMRFRADRSGCHCIGSSGFDQIQSPGTVWNRPACRNCLWRLVWRICGRAPQLALGLLVGRQRGCSIWRRTEASPGSALTV